MKKLLTFGLLLLFGCSGYESSPWGPTQKANPGFRVQVNPGTGNIDVGCTSNMDVSADKLNLTRNGVTFNAEKLVAKSGASEVRAQDVNQLMATGYIQAIHWMGINGLVSSIMSMLPGIMSRSDVPADVKSNLSQLAGQFQQYLTTVGAPPAITEAIRILATPSTQPAASQPSK